MNPTLKVSARTETGKKLKTIREKGLVPGIVYGRGASNVVIIVEGESFDKIFKSAGENTLIDLKIEGGDTRTVLIHDVAVDPVSSKPIHVDFYQVRLDEKVKTEIPLNFIGESIAVKEEKGTLLKTLQTVEVESLPTDIPHDITVDISAIKTFDDHVTVKDLKFNDNVKVLTNPEETVAMVSPPRTTEEMEKLDEDVKEDIAEVEGVDKGETEVSTPEGQDSDQSVGKENKDKSAGAKDKPAEEEKKTE
jgi:large subunit ribosomal protein L25